MQPTLYENAFSPFARKVRMVLEHKQIAHDCVDGLDLANRERLEAVNGRVEVPALVHGGIVVVGSSDIVAYLERVFPERPVYPADHAAFVHARAWERCSDTVVDPILIDISYWTWAQRDDAMPEGLLDAARADLGQIYDALERDLEGQDFVSGPLSIADIALFPHLVSARALGVAVDAEKHPRLGAWLDRMRALPIGAGDVERTKAYLRRAAAGGVNIERRKIFWRGDRIEWMLARGFHRWFFGEIEAGRVSWPGLGIPRSAR